LKEVSKIAEDEYDEVWMSDLHPNWRNVFHGLSRYYDVNVIDELAECESGWDMTTRFNDRCLSYIPIDLNCLLYKYETDFAEIAEILDDKAQAEIWRMRAKNRAAKVSYYLWDEEKGFFFDYDYKNDKLSDVWSLASYYSLWSGLATKEQAEKLVDNLDKFICEGGLSATSGENYNPVSSRYHQWAYPNGWAPLHWTVIKGLEKYDFNVMAEYISLKWISTNTQYFVDNGIFREAYNVIAPHEKPEEGLYPPQEGYGWTNAVYVDLVKKYIN
ncbi:MAG: trehalase family glycosidase, partial [Patescibacteria group bacterium]